MSDGRPPFWLNPRLHLALGVVAVLFGLAAIAFAVGDDEDGPAASIPTTTTSLPGDVVSRALDGPAAAVADPEVIRAIRDETNCDRLARMAASAHVAADRFASADPRRSNAVLYLTEVESQQAEADCGPDPAPTSVP